MVIYCTRNKKLYASKEVKEFPKMLKRSNSSEFALRDNRHYCLMRFCYIANFLT